MSRFLCLSVLSWGVSFAPAFADVVTPLAGSGAYGIRDGAANVAQFMQPTALAFDERGRLLVADAAAQRIRLVDHGVVSTIAGSGDIVGGVIVAPGYVDGPVHAARFNDPEGVAVARDGDIFVADTGNRCIRRIHAGMVSTFARNLQSPRQIVFDGNGNLLVADFGGGLLSFSPRGIASSLALPANVDRRLTGVARGIDGGGEIVYAAGISGVYGFDARTLRKVYFVSSDPRPITFFQNDTFPLDNGLALGTPYSLAAFSSREFLYTDLLNSSVSYVNQLAHQYLTVTPREGQTGDGFQRFETPGQTVVTPTAIAVAPSGAIVVADAGRKRIVSVQAPDRDGGVEAGDLKRLAAHADSYRIAVVGNSSTWEGASERNSIAHAMETELRARRILIAGKEPTVIFTSHLDDAGTNFAQNTLANGLVDLVVLFVNYENVSSFPPVKPTWKRDLHTKIQSVVRSLNEGSVKVVVVMHPMGDDLTPLDRAYFRFSMRAEYAKDGMLSREAQMLDSLRGVGAPLIDLWPEMRTEEEAPEGKPLFATFDYHLSDFGRAFVGQAIARDLISVQGWKQSP